MILSVIGFDSAKTVQIRIYNATTSTEVVAWTSTGVTERSNGLGNSVYYYDYAVVSGNEYVVDWKDNSTPANTAEESIDKSQTYVDASISSRLATAGYTAPDNATVGTINTKIGTPAATVSTDIAAVKSDTAAVKVKTDQLNFATINGATSVKADQQYTIYQVVADAGNGVNQFFTNMTFSADSAADGGWVEFVTGSLAGLGPRRIASSLLTGHKIVLSSGFVSVPAAGDQFIYINK